MSEQYFCFISDVFQLHFMSNFIFYFLFVSVFGRFLNAFFIIVIII